MEFLDKIDKILQNNQSRHSYFQLKHFVIGKELTHQGRLHACVMELGTRKKDLESLILEIEDQKDQIQLDQLEIDELKVNAARAMSRQKIDIQIKRKQRSLLGKEKRLNELKQLLRGKTDEAHYFLTCYEQLCKIEAPKEWDDPQVQLEYWNAKFTEELNMRFLMGMQVDPELVKSISALPEDCKVKKQLKGFLEEKLKQLQSIDPIKLING